MSDNHQVNDLLKKGIDAAKAKDTASARALLEQVVQLDQHNEKAWFWLAAVTDEADEKRICLGNVLVINPNNARAQKLLEQLENADAIHDIGGDFDFDAVPPSQHGRSSGCGRSPLLLIVFVLILAVVLSGAFLLLGGDDDGNDTAGTPATRNVADAGNAGNGDIAGMATALASPTPVSTRTPRPVVPTWTPVPRATVTPEVPPTLFPPPPATLGGQIIMQSGQVLGDRVNHPIVLIKPDGTNAYLLTADTRGRAPALSHNGSIYAFIEYVPGTREELLRINDLQGANPQLASTYWGGAITLSNMDTPIWSPDGFWIAFTARGPGALQPDLYRLSLLNPAGDIGALQQLTNDGTIESWPTYSPDGTRIAYVADLREIEVFEKPVDLRVISLTDGVITDLTTNGAELIESAPDWSPDGMNIVFQGMEHDGADYDIYMMPATGNGEPVKIIESNADDIRPRFSPDGTHIVFTSNRTGNWEVFVYDLTTNTMYQITNNRYDDIANDWSN